MASDPIGVSCACRPLRSGPPDQIRLRRPILRIGHREPKSARPIGPHKAARRVFLAMTPDRRANCPLRHESQIRNPQEPLEVWGGNGFDPLPTHARQRRRHSGISSQVTRWNSRTCSKIRLKSGLGMRQMVRYCDTKGSHSPFRIALKKHRKRRRRKVRFSRYPTFYPTYTSRNERPAPRHKLGASPAFGRLSIAGARATRGVPAMAPGCRRRSHRLCAASKLARALAKHRRR
jgi:hypothetical protein